MNSLREFIGSSSGLALMRQGLGLGWIARILAVLVVLLGVGEARADTKCPSTWTACSPSSDCALVEPQETYRYCTYGLDADCHFYIVDCWYSSTPCSESEQPTAPIVLTRKIECSHHSGCAESNSTEPYRHCTTYYDARGDVYLRHCDCSSTSCAEAESAQMTAVLTPAAVGRPAQHWLGDSYPNPFNPAVVLPLDLAKDAAAVSLAVYDVLGRRVRQVWDGPLGAGRHRFTWDGRDEVGKDVAAGVYIYKVEIDGQVEAKKLTKLP
ncbi:MAG: T9SS type A sorting domain-containing protein [Gemmatimonadota bacterium]|nr:T9SS type A sorting domain-containing protein [Gemmatimonadota bacterium]